MTNNEQIKNLALALIESNTEKEAIDILKQYNLWDNKDLWHPLGGRENNYGAASNQQDTPEAALVEKIINSVDAVLTKECLKRYYSAEDRSTPRSIQAAQKEFFDIDDGTLVNIPTVQRRELSKNITLLASGLPKKPSFAIIDKGEGQHPEKFKDTFLSIEGSNKIRIQFVQGKYGMGGTGFFVIALVNINYNLLCQKDVMN